MLTVMESVSCVSSHRSSSALQKSAGFYWLGLILAPVLKNKKQQIQDTDSWSSEPPMDPISSCFKEQTDGAQQAELVTMVTPVQRLLV